MDTQTTIGIGVAAVAYLAVVCTLALLAYRLVRASGELTVRNRWSA